MSTISLLAQCATIVLTEPDADHKLDASSAIHLFQLTDMPDACLTFSQ